jgi:hypothetical protein
VITLESTSILANAISLLFLMPFFLGVKYYIFSFRDRQRKQRIGLAMLLGMGVIYNLALYVGTKNEHFDTKGRAVKYYALVPGGVVFSDRAGTEPKYGVLFRPVSRENIRWLLRIQQGRIQEVLDPASHDWFDGVIGDPLLWYYSDTGGNLHLFDGPGYAPATRAELKPVTPEIRQVWESAHTATTQQENATRVGRASAPLHETPSLDNTYDLYRGDTSATSRVGSMNIFNQKGESFDVQGSGWNGRGSVTGSNGYYNWRFADGKIGRTGFSVDADGVLHGHVEGSGMNWSYVARPRVKDNSYPRLR